ncbi:MAG TPA: radical SAM protein [Bacteroidales bacterium]|nr:radical SAM protein [Bacteroidales bacterium]
MPGIDCLFVTSSKSRAIQFSIYPYLGVGYLAELLQREQLSSELYDIDLHRGNIRKLISLIATTRPLVIGYSIMSISLPLFYRITIEIRKKYPEIIIVAGGPHVTNDPDIIGEMGLDYGFTGHAEQSFPLFLKKIAQGDYRFDDIKGLIIPSQNRKDKPAFYDVTQSDNLPLYKLYDINKYQNIFYGRKWFTMITTRGCAYNCKFCKDPGKNKYKEYPLDSVKQQIRYLVVDKKLEWISFVDDTFTYNRQRVVDLCNWIIAEKIKFKWTCCTRADTLDPELIRIMKNAGLHYAIIGVEAGDEDIRKKINKNIPSSQYISIINCLRENHVRVLCSYVLGNPGESYEQIHQTIRFSKRLRANYAQYYNMTALPQSPIFKYGIGESNFESDIWKRYMRGESDLPYYIPKNLQLKKLKRIKMMAFIGYYLQPVKFFDLGIRLFKFFFDTGVRN